MGEFDDIDALLNENTSWANKKSGILQQFPLLKNNPLQGINISFNVRNPQIKKIVELSREGKHTEALASAQNNFQRAVLKPLQGCLR